MVSDTMKRLALILLTIAIDGCLLNEHVHSEIQKPVEIRGANPRLIDIAAFGYHKLEVNVYNDSRDLVKVSNSILSLMLRTQQNRPSTLIGNDIECCYSADDSQFTVVPPGGYTQVSGLVSKQIAEMIRDAGACEVVIRTVLPDEKRQSLRIKINLDKNA